MKHNIKVPVGLIAACLKGFAVLLMCGMMYSVNAGSISFDMDTYAETPGNQVNVTIHFDFTDQAMLGGGFNVIYDPSVLEFVSYTRNIGPEVQDAASPIGSLQSPGNYLGAGVGTFDFFTGINTAGDIGTFVFNVLGAGGDGGCGATLCLTPVDTNPMTSLDGQDVTVEVFSNGITASTILNSNGVCGDSSPDLGEECDDGNVSNGDGCDATCTVEAGFNCTAAIAGMPPSIPPTPSMCFFGVCGDSNVDAGEECDDGNQISGDGCSAGCTVELTDTDGDGIPDIDDVCPTDPSNDADDDGVCGGVDNCPTVPNADQADADGDGVGNVCTTDIDDDLDFWNNDLDNCPQVPNTDQADTDGDAMGDACDVCALDPANDGDGDGVCGDIDNCPTQSNADQADTPDGDGMGNICDSDDDNDGIDDMADNCPLDSNPSQLDFDGDNEGDVCDSDVDGDGVNEAVDECPATPVGDVTNQLGCGVAQLCPCDNNWKNHGGYVKCVAHTSEDFLDAGLITELEKDGIVSTAGQSSCGSKK